MAEFDQIYNYASGNAKKLGDKYVQLLEIEYKEIKKQGAEQYWIDLIKSKKKFKTNKNLLVTPFLLGITDIDPVEKHGELISTRLSGKFDVENDPGAFKDKDLPDIDLDFISDAKDVVREYASEQYGHDKVCSVGLWQTYKPRSSLKDVAKSLGYKDKLSEIEKMTKELPDEFDEIELEDAIKDYEEFGKWYREDRTNREIAKYAFRLVGKIKTQGQHAGGLIISSVPLPTNLPMARIGSKGKERWTSEWTEGRTVQLSKFGFVKYDVLGLKTLQYIYEASKMIERNHGIKIDWDEIGVNDVESLKTANELKTDSIFQLDTDVAKGILSRGGVKNIMDILVYTSLGRPGPMPMIDEYIARRDSENDEWRQKEHPKVLELTKDTWGVIVFQEQMTTVLTELAGFSLPEAEYARKIMSKKWKDKLPWVRDKVIKGLSYSLPEPCPTDRPNFKEDDVETIAEWKQIDKASGTDEWTWAKEYWLRLSTFGRYSFNRSHAVSYSLQVYRCLYLKTHYSSEWWCAVLNCCRNDKLPNYIRMARSEGAKFGTLDINNLSKKFDSVDGKIVPGLMGIKGIGDKLIAKIDTNIDDIKDIDDYVERQFNNKTFIERLVHLGAFDKVHKNRKALWYWYLFKYGATDEAVQIRKVVNNKFEYTEEQLEEIREELYKEHKRKHPKSNKVPKRIRTHTPKPNPSREQVMALIEEDYSYEQLLQFQVDFLGYHWDSPMDIYGYKGSYTIKNAPNTGILECVISSKEIRKTSNGNKYMTLMVTDGLDMAKVQVWGNEMSNNDESLFEPGVGLNIKVEYKESYKSFSLRKNSKITKLPKVEEVKKLASYIEDKEIFPEEIELEDDFYGDI